ncbi:regulator of chromosome condensation (RCC1) domain containing protein, putative [Babesia bigemina]|uniref:Regulator of chromosome condensation (RCC1) domain containing protein, putative n=1 Tax=Babesia bigemina TaxID=5866 RepID=A0A061DBX7_BABBI|nr:regulator of chromosome condensation (RCC1) domain containing protein, putative [Babesia bigemina]CDR96394.1 regulator of chromosome condensation (RCC1) domain containing protein, putative [Babesia bigemina]|eukprot:XP_012768580.1 regulator of chromosome condensation (RCC1) domain containing protein, putative [Babesia bigemina]
MAGWVCDVCLVPNDEDVAACCCCTTPRPTGAPSAPSNGGTSTTVQVSESVDNSQPETKDVNKDVKRIRYSFPSSELPLSCIMVVGSSEVDQLPRSICDSGLERGSKNKVSLYECSLPTPVTEGIRGWVSSVACGSLHTAVVSRTGEVFTFGCNDLGALGRSENDTDKDSLAECNPCPVRLRHTVSRVSCGDNHTLFLTTSGAVFFTGAFRDTQGNIGIADYDELEKLTNAEHFKTPVMLPFISHGDNPIKDICSGENHCLLLPTDGSGIYVFGSNEFGQLMLPSGYAITTPTEEKPDLSSEETMKLALTWPQFLNVDDLGLMKRRPGGEAKRRKHGDEFVSRIFTGYCTSFFETGVSRRIYGSGRNAQGELGTGGDELQLSHPTELVGLRGLRISKIVGGQFFTVALTTGGNLYSWGNRSYTGTGSDDDYATQRTPAKIQFFKDNVRNVFVGADATFAVVSHGKVYAWGSGQNYVLGNGKDCLFQKTPELVPKKHFRGHKVVGGMGGSQHTVFLCRKKV